MAIERIPMERLSQLAKRNKEFRWPTRATRNRLEPVCSPRFDPAFKITSTDNIFTLGSCFANSIAVELRALGLKVFPEDIKKDIPSEFRTNNLDFHYTPKNILQSLKWALEPDKINARQNCYIKMNDGLFFDPTLGHKVPGKKQALDQINKSYTESYRSILKCNVIIITLGLIECIFDKDTGIYLENWPGDVSSDEELSKYEIQILDHEEVSSTLSEIYKLLSEFIPDDFNLILTVSPVPLASTFRNCDVLVANSYSKSVLRTAAEGFSKNHKNVDYLPVYESVSYSDRMASWDTDLRHPSQFIVQLNMLRMLRAYLIGAEDNNLLTDRLKAIEEQVIDHEKEFQASWPEQLRAFRADFSGAEKNLTEYVNKSEKLIEIQNQEINRLNQLIELMKQKAF